MLTFRYYNYIVIVIWLQLKRNIIIRSAVYLLSYKFLRINNFLHVIPIYRQRLCVFW